MLPAEPRTYLRFPPWIFLQHKQRWHLPASLRQFGTGLASRKWDGTEDPARNELSMGWQRGCYGHTDAGFRVYPVSARSRLVRSHTGWRQCKNNSRNQSRGVTAHCSTQENRADRNYTLKT